MSKKLLLTRLLPLSFSIIAMFLTGLLGLSQSHSNALGLFLLCIFVFGSGTFFQRLAAQNSKPWWIFSLAISGLVFYVVTGLILHPKSWNYAPPHFILICFIAGFFFTRKRKIIKYLLWGGISAIYCFYWLPYCMFTANTLQTFKGNRSSINIHEKADSLSFLDENLINQIPQFKGKTVFIETWNESCAICFHAMSDLHPYLTKMEQQDSTFIHYYLYTNSRLPESLNETIFQQTRIPFKDQRILFDSNSKFRNIVGLMYNPQFIVICPDGNISYLAEGYDKAHKWAARQMIDKQIKFCNYFCCNLTPVN